MKSALSLSDMSRPGRDPLVHLDNADLMPLPLPLDDPAEYHAWRLLSA